MGGRGLGLIVFVRVGITYLICLLVCQGLVGWLGEMQS